MENILQEIKEKLEQISLLKEDIKTLENKYAEVNRKFNKGDVVVNKDVNDTTFIISDNAEYLYSAGIIYYDATILSTRNPLFLRSKGTTFSLPETHLKINNG